MKNFLFLTLSLLVFACTNLAAEPLIWSVNTREDVLKGNAQGVSIEDNGSIRLAPKLSEVFATGQPFVWSSAVDASGNFYLGTGGDGKIFKIAANGTGALFYDAAELNVSALAIAGDGTIFAGTSPDGKVYRIDRNGAASVYFEPKEKYIWSLAVLADGSLAVGTGENGKIYKIRRANSSPAEALLFDTSETHIISLAADKTGNLFAGTDSEGLVLRFSADGKPFALLDSTLREIHEISIGADGSVYVLALGESASTSEKKTEEKKAEDKTVSVADKNQTQPAAATEQKSLYDLSSAKSAVYRILPDGGTDIVWKSDEITAFSVLARAGGGVFIGTSDRGRIYTVQDDGKTALTLQTGEEQVSTIRASGSNFFATTSNLGKFFRFGAERVAEGFYESPVLDAKTTASWGTIWWRSGGNVRIQTRSGNTAAPNETWSNWTPAKTDQAGAKIDSPKARFLQWRAVLSDSQTEAVLYEVNISFLPRNIPPEVLSIEILPANIGLAPNPEVQVDPNIETLGLDPADFGIVIPPAVPRKVFQIGAKSLQWKAEDRNGDELVYSIFYREVGERDFKLLRAGVVEPFFTIDSLAFADGRYVFKIVASDLPANPAPLALTGELSSEPFDIDNTAPTVTAVGTPQVSGDSVRVAFEARENSSFIKRAEYSINGGVWKTVFAEDGISDSRNERYRLDLRLENPGEYSIALRVFDANGNAGKARVLVRK